GVVSPLLANIYLHWFDRVFYAKAGPARWAKAVLVRYADDFVILTREVKGKLRKFVEEKIEVWLGLRINREKTRLINLREPGQRLDFLGYSFRLDRDRCGRKLRYWNMCPSTQAIARERERLRRMINKSRCFQPLPNLIQELNRHLKAWSNYFRPGYSRDAFRQINSYVRLRLALHLRRHSQRPWRPAQGTSKCVCTLINSDSSICESFVQERPAKAGCGKSARPVCGGGGNAAVIGFASSRASLSTLLQNLFYLLSFIPSGISGSGALMRLWLLP